MLEKYDVYLRPFNCQRILHIYLPNDYYQSDERYPVVYMFDGHNLFLNSDATYGKSWGLADFLDHYDKKLIIEDKVLSLPKKEKTAVTNFLDKDGVLFSGGELQRILLARALYKDAPLLLLDEPTSALDPLAETAIYEQYHRLSEGKTTIFISHRLASTKFCDRIIYYENGQVKEDGTHDELMKKNGAYAKMFEIQSQYYNEKGGDFDE